ncbi:uncharacterized protein LOC141665730 [Apium graveolens]|uniref:uncharacterized protein LOC141665730 n=1 Tax=Apium graveolens TaxID=4045 RepID=UPI003D790B85
MVVKSVSAENYVRDLQEVFDILRSYNMKLNPSKCNFAVSSGKFLGHMVTRRGIEASPEQIKAIFELKSPSNVKDVQKLTGRVAALNRFILRSSDRCKLFYDVLRKSKGFLWSEKYETALSDLKRYLTTPPLLSKPTRGEDLHVYLSVTDHAVSDVLVKENEGVQSLVYYISKTLVDAETRCRIGVSASSRVDVKPQTLYIDGASNVNRTGLGFALKLPRGDIIAQSVCCDFKATNNEAEYEALIMGLIVAKNMKIKNIEVKCDSLLIVNHVKGCYEAKDSKMVAYLDITKRLTNCFDNFSIQQVPRENNVQADALAGLGVVLKNIDLNNIPVVHIVKPAMKRLALSIEKMTLDQRNVDTNEDADNWIKRFKDYLQFGTVPTNNNEARVLRMKASRFTIIDGELFKKSSTWLLQRCLRRHEADLVLRDAHEGECGNHTNGRNLSLKILRLGYYWMTLRQDALDYAKKCDACQRLAPVIHQPSEQLHTSISSWPFMK